MWRVYAIVLVLWLALLPPLFTDGACTAQFEAESARLQADAASLRSAERALSYWAGRALPVSTLSADECRQAKPRFLSQCGSGAWIFVRVPVQNRICRLYRDDEVRVQLQYDDLGRLARIATDMNPFRSFPVPFTGVVIHWAR